MFKTEREIYIVLLIAAGVITIILVSFFILLLKQYRAHKILFKEKMLAEITATEKERKKLAGDIHDDIGPLLAATRMQVKKASPEALDKAVTYIDDLMVQVRAISHTLMPVSLSRLGLVAAVKDFCDSVSSSGGLSITYDLEETGLGENEIHLYRIIHEIVNNTLRHAEASLLHITIRKETRKLTIATADNGKGTDMNHHNPGHGLKNIASRAELLGGDLYIETAPGKGMHFTLEIPLNEIAFSNSGR
ncbi:MAG: putative signal transduction histidine kinase [Chitinophagaceae bacterium]|nr:putative signal transduction histidine kinase [Chitinophagaceae bacterium]